MYKPDHLTEANLRKIQSLIDRYSFGLLICPLGNQTPHFSHLPFMLDRHAAPYGTLLSHVARANPISRFLDDSNEAVVIFSGPHGYISPSWYKSRIEVPTWNYSVVHAYGRPRVLDDDEFTTLLHDVVNKHEQGNPDRWRIDELSPSFFDELKAEILGFAIPITRIESKFKLGQNRIEEDRRGTVEGLLRRGEPLDHDLAQMMKETLANEHGG
jgi:transcriptional regulator